MNWKGADHTVLRRRESRRCGISEADGRGVRGGAARPRASGIIHRDIIAVNILAHREVGPARRGAWARIIDFGIAKARHPESCGRRRWRLLPGKRLRHGGEQAGGRVDAGRAFGRPYSLG